MSILPPYTQGPDSSSSSADPSKNPTSEHGSSPSLSPPSFSPIPISFGSLTVADPESLSSMSNHSPVSLAPAAEDVRGSPKEVIQSGTRRGQETFSHQDTERDAHFLSSGQRPRHRGKTSGAARSSQGQQNGGQTNSPRSSPHQNPTGRRAHTISGNHLLNFHYDPVTRSQPRAPPPLPRRQYKRKPYNKDLFLQANYKFVVVDTGDYSPESMDPDKMLQWEDIICVRYSTPLPVQCPICLEYPLCPQITSCGHIFCFPCILQYLLMGVENHRIECFKRCPLCFVMVSPKDLYTISIENVKQVSLGDTIEFVLLTRQRDSFTPSQKNEQESLGTLSNCSVDIYDPFSKFTFTTDVDLSVRKAISDLDSWFVRADSGLVDDLEKLPYVSAALEHLEQRKKYWNEHRIADNNRFSKKADYQMQSMSRADISRPDRYTSSSGHRTPTSDSDNQNDKLIDSLLDKSDGETSLDKSGDDDQSIEDQETVLSSSCERNKDLLRHSNGSKDIKVKDSYNFYQAVDGQHIIIHPLNMKCLLHHYGSYDMFPPRLSGRILELETVTQSEAMRKRYRYLSHFSLTTTYQLCEIDLSSSLPPDALAPFMDEIKKRERQRKQRARKERKDKIKAEVAAAAEFVPMLSPFGQSSHNDSPPFSLDDFEALGNSAPVSSSPPNVGERNTFSNVTRLGFAAGHDSPGLKIEESTNVHHNNEVTNGSAGSRNPRMTSFANVISRAPTSEGMNEAGKKGKKATRVLLSTAGGRRY